MADRLKFHLDEHVSHAVAHGLRRADIDVTTTSDAGLVGVDDVGQLAYAHKEGRVVVTHDSDFLRLANEGVSHAGIAYSVMGRRSIGEMIRVLVLMWEVLTPEELVGHVEFL